MQGYYECKKCNIVIDVITSSRSAKRYSIKVRIPKCPHCGGKVKEMEYEDFKKAKPKLFLRLIRTFNFKHVGNRNITMKVKFL
jgi:NAD-dependent SIR2 family protein deacetylase